jgi:hypothetical protein
MKKLILILLTIIFFTTPVYSQVRSEYDPSTGETSYQTDRFVMTSYSENIVRSEGTFGYTQGDYVFMLSFASATLDILYSSIPSFEFSIDGRTARATVEFSDESRMIVGNTNLYIYVYAVYLSREDLEIISRASIVNIGGRGATFTLPNNVSYYINSLLEMTE